MISLSLKPIHMCFYVKQALDVLKGFKDNEIIDISTDYENDEYLLVGNKGGKCRLPIIPISNALGMQEKFPGKIDDSGVVNYRYGTIRPDLFAVVDASKIQQAIKNNKTKNVTIQPT